MRKNKPSSRVLDAKAGSVGACGQRAPPRSTVQLQPTPPPLSWCDITPGLGGVIPHSRGSRCDEQALVPWKSEPILTLKSCEKSVV